MKALRDFFRQTVPLGEVECDTCRFFDFFAKRPSGDRFGYCYRYPPSVHEIHKPGEGLFLGEGLFEVRERPAQRHPVMNSAHWCGEWKQKLLEERRAPHDWP